MKSSPPRRESEASLGVWHDLDFLGRLSCGFVVGRRSVADFCVSGAPRSEHREARKESQRIKRESIAR